MLRSTRNKLKSPYRYSTGAAIFSFFIEKCVRHLKPGGELVFIVPREFIKLTAAKKLNRWLFEQGSITHFMKLAIRGFSGSMATAPFSALKKGRMDHSMPTGEHSPKSTGN